MEVGFRGKMGLGRGAKESVVCVMTIWGSFVVIVVRVVCADVCTSEYIREQSNHFL